MQNASYKPARTGTRVLGWGMAVAALALLVPYTILTMQFDYPDILRADAGEILTRFRAGGSGLIWTWWSFAVVGLPLLLSAAQLGKMLEDKAPFMRWATTLGVIGLTVQMVGLLRWTFVVPGLARAYAEGDAATRAAAKIGFALVHQYGGVVLGEHLGQLFTILWTVALAVALRRYGMPRWMALWAYGASAIYLGAQAELFATVMPEIVYWEPAGFVGSTLWLLWIVGAGVWLARRGATLEG